MAIFEFTKATKAKAKARIGLVGPSGSGKTYTALSIAQGLGERIALIDTEHGSASKYAGQFEFDVLELDTFSPDIYTQAIQAAEQAGFDVVIIDSLSHAWTGKDGALEQVDKAAARNHNNSFAGWRDVTPMHNRMIDAIVGCKIHVIATMRSKTEYILEQQKRGSKTVNVPKKVGMAPVQRDGMEYEFDIIGDLDLDHNLIITKTRCLELDNEVIKKPDAEFGETVKAWLSDGVDKQPPHWSDKVTNRQKVEAQLGKKKIPVRVLFEACGVESWSDMTRYEGTGKDAIDAAVEYWNTDSKVNDLFDDVIRAEVEPPTSNAGYYSE